MINSTALTIFGIWVAIGIYVLILQRSFDKKLEKVKKAKALKNSESNS